eukprot:2890434-Pleurochrysis_carterae.AAC.1
MEFNSLEAAGHVVWRSWTEYEEERRRVSLLMTSAADDEDAKKELHKLLSTHAATHLDATYLCAP